jgi:hypothetical protein
MTPNTNTQHTFTTSRSFMPGHRFSPMNHGLAHSRRTSPVLSAQELRQLVSQMVD